MTRSQMMLRLLVGAVTAILIFLLSAEFKFAKADDFDPILSTESMTLPNEAIPNGAVNALGKPYDWALHPKVTMGNDPTKSGLPAWYAGLVYPTYPVIVPWFIVYRAQGALPINTRVEISGLQLWIKGKSTGLWYKIEDIQIPQGADYIESMIGNKHQPWVVQTEFDGNESLLPPVGYASHGWGTRKTIDPYDIAGVYVQISARVVTLDPTKSDTRLTDQWVISVGADYWSADGLANVDCFDGQFVRVMDDWRTVRGGS